MSSRGSRRSHAATSIEQHTIPISDIRTRKWTKQLKTVGHITIFKWVPDQEKPTDALQKGSYKKNKGRKRPGAELGRMTRSVRQHLDAPLELLNEIPTLRQSSRIASAAAVEVIPTVNAVADVSPATKSTANANDAYNAIGADAMFPNAAASEEQLEEALDDLPFFTESLESDPALQMGIPPQNSPRRPNNQTQPNNPTSSVQSVNTVEDADESKNESAEEEEENLSSSSGSSSAEDDDDDDGAGDDDDDDGTVSADSTSPLPSPSPTTSPIISRSNSP